MSFIVKGIDLPEEGQRLKITVCHNGKIFIDKQIYYEEAEAIQIPRGHGRIGDLDELQKAIRTDIMGGLNYEWFIEDAPTILEPEDECKRCKHKGDEYWCRNAYEDDEGKCSIYEPYGGIE